MARPRLFGLVWPASGSRLCAGSADLARQQSAHSAVLGFSELLQMQDDVPESVKSDLRLIQKESARACGIIRNLALFARQTPGEAAPRSSQ